MKPAAVKARFCALAIRAVGKTRANTMAMIVSHSSHRIASHLTSPRIYLTLMNLILISSHLMSTHDQCISSGTPKTGLAIGMRTKTARFGPCVYIRSVTLGPWQRGLDSTSEAARWNTGTRPARAGWAVHMMHLKRAACISHTRRKQAPKQGGLVRVFEAARRAQDQRRAGWAVHLKRRAGTQAPKQRRLDSTSAFEAARRKLNRHQNIAV